MLLLSLCLCGLGAVLRVPPHAPPLPHLLLSPPLPRAAHPHMMGGTRRTSRVGQVVRSELATVIRLGSVKGKQRCPEGLHDMVSIVDVDMSPDLRNARVKVSIIGDRKDKISAVRYLKANVRGFRHALAQRNRQMKRVPMLTFDHVDVGAATDMMVRLDALSREREAAEERRRAAGEDVPDEEGGFDFAASDEDAFDFDTELALDEADEDGVWDDEDEELEEEGDALLDEDEDDEFEDDELEAAWEREVMGGEGK